MRRPKISAAIVATLALLFVALATVSSAPSASGQSEGTEARPRVQRMEFSGAEASGISVHPSFAGSGDEGAVTPTTGGTEGAPAGGGETVLGPDGRIRVTPGQAVQYPHRAIGQIEFVQDGFEFICTGFLVDSNSILTAGHCAYDPNGASGNIIEFAQFFPGRYRTGPDTGPGTINNPFGFCNVLTAGAPIEWRANGSEYADYAVMNLDCNVGNTTGWLGFFYLNSPNPNALAGLPVRVEGWPGDKPFGSEWYMGGTVSQSQKKMIFYPIDTFGGQSGSPVYQLNRPGCGHCAAGIHAYGFPHSVGPHQNRNHGPRFTPARFNFIEDLIDANGP